MKKHVVALLVMVAPVVAFGMDGNKDQSFFNNAAEAGMAEVHAGQLAQQKGTSQSVKDFGAMMVKDHTAAGEKLQALASSEGVKLPSHPSLTQRADAKELQMGSGNSFDQAYIKSQIKAHQEAVALFQKEISTGQDAQAQQFANATSPTLKMHLSKINQIAAAAGVNP